MAGSAPTPRTTAVLVQQIISTKKGVDLTPFIAAANQLTTDVCTYPTPYTDGFVGSKMELIERWLAAHFYTVFDNQLTMAKAGTVSVGYQNKIDYGLRSSIYGQNALMLDTNGGLAQLNNSAAVKRKIKVGIYWLGRRGYHREDCADADLTVEQ